MFCVLSLAACQAGTPECKDGEYPLNGSCVPIPPDAGFPRDQDGGEEDVGLVHPDAGDAGAPPPIDGAVHDSGYHAAPPVVGLGVRDRILLTGTAVLPMGAAPELIPGEVYVENGRIACVGGLGACAAMSSGASVIETGGVILPGLIDSHNHLAYNWLPEFTPGRLFQDHQQWQGSAEYDAFNDAYSMNSGDRERACAMAQWGELRALTSGTTSIYGATVARTCIRWLVRNAELSANYHGFSTGDRMRSNVLGIDTVNATEAAALIADMQSGEVAAYMIHVAEGISPRAKSEFDDLEALGLLRSQTVLIHGTALAPAEFARVGAAGAKLVWSPSSNFALYGQTTDVVAAHAAGVSFSIAPDWTPSGVDVPLAEVRFARAHLESIAPGMFSDRDLLERITSVPAQVMAIDGDVGTLAVGKLADLVVLAVDPGNVYRSVLEARPHDIRLVMIGGVPHFGDTTLVGVMRETPESCHLLPVCNQYKNACWNDPPDGPVSPDSIASVITSFFPEGPFGLFQCN